VAWVTAWRSRGGKRPSYDVAVDPEDGVDDVATNLMTRLMLSHPASAVVLGALLATVAAFTITQVGAVWPFGLLDDWLGLGRSLLSLV
jgi:hypothetical protein